MGSSKFTDKVNQVTFLGQLYPGQDFQTGVIHTNWSKWAQPDAYANTLSQMITVNQKLRPINYIQNIKNEIEALKVVELDFYAKILGKRTVKDFTTFKDEVERRLSDNGQVFTKLSSMRTNGSTLYTYLRQQLKMNEGQLGNELFSKKQKKAMGVVPNKKGKTTDLLKGRSAKEIYEGVEGRGGIKDTIIKIGQKDSYNSLAVVFKINKTDLAEIEKELNGVSSLKLGKAFQMSIKDNLQAFNNKTLEFFREKGVPEVTKQVTETMANRLAVNEKISFKTAKKIVSRHINDETIWNAFQKDIIDALDFKNGVETKEVREFFQFAVTLRRQSTAFTYRASQDRSEPVRKFVLDYLETTDEDMINAINKALNIMANRYEGRLDRALLPASGNDFNKVAGNWGELAALIFESFFNPNGDIQWTGPDSLPDNLGQKKADVILDIYGIQAKNWQTDTFNSNPIEIKQNVTQMLNNINLQGNGYKELETAFVNVMYSAEYEASIREILFNFLSQYMAALGNFWEARYFKEQALQPNSTHDTSGLWLIGTEYLVPGSTILQIIVDRLEENEKNKQAQQEILYNVFDMKVNDSAGQLEEDTLNYDYENRTNKDFVLLRDPYWVWSPRLKYGYTKENKQRYKDLLTGPKMTFTFSIKFKDIFEELLSREEVIHLNSI